MKRRSFLGSAAATAAGAATLGAPGWVRRAFAQDDRDRGAELAALSSSYRSAQQRGRPLLVIVVPEDGGRRYSRGQAFGELLNHGPDSVFADLALAEVVCCSMHTLRRLVPQVGDGEPLLVVIETDAHPAGVQRLDAALPEEPNRWANEAPWEEFERNVERAIDARIAVLSGLVHEGLARDEAMLGRRARAAERRLDAALARTIARAASRGEIATDHAQRAPAIVRAAARGAHADAARDALAAVARAELTEGPVPGSEWAVGHGCGTTIEGREDSGMMMACGMGHVAERSARFLYWYTD